MPYLRYKKVEHLSCPFPITQPGSAGIDLMNNGEKVIMSETNKLYKVTTDCILIPKGYFGLIKCKSSFASKYGMTIHGGVIDAGYTDPIIVLVSGFFEQMGTFECEQFSAIAQLIILPLYPCSFTHLDEAQWPKSRGGFGSSGANELQKRLENYMKRKDVE